MEAFKYKEKNELEESSHICILHIVLIEWFATVSGLFLKLSREY